MDNPQYYQPLSHALHPPSAQAQYYKPSSSGQQHEDESDDDDEGMVEEQLSRNDESPKPKAALVPESSQHTPSSSHHDTEPKRRGRPRGSKNRRTRVSTPQTSSKSQPPSHTSLNPTGQASNPPQLPEVTAQNQQYYEFQWRVLNLCAEFYGAAEELVKGTPALVIAQCYQMGPGSKVDPLTMLNEAKQNCDTLLANPSRLITAPPPSIYPVAQQLFSSGPAVVAPIPAAAAPTAPPTVINQPQSFVVSMNNPPYHTAVYAPPPGQYPTASYYQYPYGHPGYYHAAAPVAAPTQPPQSQPHHMQPSTTHSPAVAAPASGVGNQGSWSDDEIARLRKLADETKNSAGEIDWDGVVNKWGPTRTRHMVLIKATQLGLKESSTVRGVKRRRENEGNGDTSSPAPTPTSASAAAPAPTSVSTPSSTPIASPSLQQQRPPVSSSNQAPSVSTTPAPPVNQPWPMPVVAANTSSPVIGSSTTSYYRPRPTESPKPPSRNQHQTHRFMYHHPAPNGRSDSAK